MSKPAEIVVKRHHLREWHTVDATRAETADLATPFGSFLNVSGRRTRHCNGGGGCGGCGGFRGNRGQWQWQTRGMNVNVSD